MSTAPDPAVVAVERHIEAFNAFTRLSADAGDAAREAADTGSDVAYERLGKVAPTTVTGCVVLLRQLAFFIKEDGDAERPDLGMVRNLIDFLRGNGTPDPVMAATQHYDMLIDTWDSGPRDTNADDEMELADGALAVLRATKPVSLPGVVTLLQWVLAMMEEHWVAEGDTGAEAAAAVLRNAIGCLDGRRA